VLVLDQGLSVPIAVCDGFFGFFGFFEILWVSPKEAVTSKNPQRIPKKY
jgi:hypothetical protein